MERERDHGLRGYKGYSISVLNLQEHFFKHFLITSIILISQHPQWDENHLKRVLEKVPSVSTGMEDIPNISSNYS